MNYSKEAIENTLKSFLLQISSDTFFTVLNNEEKRLKDIKKEKEKKESIERNKID